MKDLQQPEALPSVPTEATGTGAEGLTLTLKVKTQWARSGIIGMLEDLQSMSDGDMNENLKHDEQLLVGLL